MENKKYIGYAAAVTSTVLLASEGVFVRNVAVSATVMTFARLGIGLVFLFFYLCWKKEIAVIKSTKITFSLLSTGVLLSGASLCYISALQMTSLANAVFLLYLGPLLAVGIAALLFRERFTILNIALLGVAFVGFLFLLEFQFAFEAGGSKAILWGVGSGFCYAFYIALNRNIADDVPASIRTFYQLLVGAVVMIPFLDASLFSVTPREVAWLIALGFFHGFLAFSMIIFALKLLKAVEYGTISYIEPLAASLIGYILYAETLTTYQLIGCAIIFTGGMVQVLASKSQLNPN